MIKKLVIATILTIIVVPVALLGLAIYLGHQREATANTQAQSYATQFADRLTEATKEKIPREAEAKRIARDGHGVSILSYPKPGNGATLLFKSISLPFVRPLGYAYSRVERCYNATMSIGHPVELTETDCH